MAELWGAALGKAIKVQPSDADGLDGVEKHFAAGIGPAWGRDLRLVSMEHESSDAFLFLFFTKQPCAQMYEVFNHQCFYGKGFAFNDEEFEAQKKLLGREPSSYEDFVKTEVAAWTKEH